MGLRADPMGGGQFKQAVKAIMEAERQPVRQMEARKTREEGKLKLFDEFKSKFAGFDRTLTDFSNPTLFREFKVDLGEGANLAGVTIDKSKVQPGSYHIEIGQLAARSSIISNNFEDPDAAVLGAGYVVVDTANGKEEIFVGGNQASLRGIANMINQKGLSAIRATVVKDESDSEKPWRLIVTSKKEGLDQEVEFPEFYFLDGEEDLRIAANNDAQNAILKVDGFEIEAGSNKITDFMTGLNLELKQAKEGQSFNLTVSEDIPKMAGKVKGMVDQINGILGFINKQNQVDDKSNTSSSFAGDTSLQTIEYRLRNLLHEGFPAWDNPNDPDTPRLIFLNQLGISFDKGGSVTIAEDKFQKALEGDVYGITEAITGEYGFAAQMKEVMNGYTQPGNGLLAIREKGMRSRIAKIDRDIEYKERLLERRQETLTGQFSRLQGTLNGMQQQQAYLSASMGGGGGGNMIQQLMGG